MNWYIGQQIVAIKNHSMGVFKMGDEFVVKSLRLKRCNCKGHSVLIDIGLEAKSQIGEIVNCPFCYAAYIKEPIWWMSEACFAPLDVDISELTEILELQND